MSDLPPTSPDGGSRPASLEELRELMGDCRRCALGATRTRLVFGVGDPHARLMLVGEAPGKNEDLQGEPFVGAAGKGLDRLLAGIGLTRDRIYIANVLKSRPPGNRDPLPAEIEACTPFLREQIRLVDPVVIATLGNFATRFMLGRTEGITRLRGRLFGVEGRLVVPIFHPAVALYDPKKSEVLDEDFRRLAAVLARVESGELTVGDAESPDGAGGFEATVRAPVPAGEPDRGLVPGAPEAGGPPSSRDPEQAALDLGDLG